MTVYEDVWMLAATPILSPTAGYTMLAIFSVLWIALGIWWGRRASTYEGFAVAGRNVGLALGTATAVATWITSNTTMLAPQFALQLGIWGALAYCTASFGLFAFAPMSGRIRQLMPEGYTAVEFVRRRYGLVATVPFLIISLFYAITWLISMSMAGGKLLEVLAGIPYEVGMTVVITVCVAYTLFGGMYAVIGTDFIQSLIILIGLVVVTIAVLSQVEIADVHEKLQADRPMLLSIFFPAALMAIFNNMLFGFGEIFHSNVWWSRAFAMRAGVGPKAYVLGGLLWLPIPIVAGFLGLAAPALGIGISQPDTVGPLVAATLLGDVGAVLVFIVVFCSLASSIDSLLAATSDLVVNDIAEPLVPGSVTQRQKRLWSGVSIVALGGLAWAVALPNVSDLATVLFFAGPLVGSCIWPIVGGLYYRRPGPIAAASAMVAGSLIGLAAYFLIGWMVASLVGAAVSGIVFAVLVWLRPNGYDFKLLSAPATRPQDVADDGSSSVSPAGA
ncbi:sodium:solute symporter family protein [Allorhodopirellula heiligendammensis]|uniref:Sodium/proline symporter n=1 Tax=Allorhodopirellula heiligendammensis TaxID=2714739 RepID=A0A5C6C635_9BACT|nr:sodium:solute symporter family protein [Allorhodopirellula heiligendammensis]TWU18824.1 Sodium/proline symporter [Allorhodopirellula heiligendammensis]